MDAAKMFLTRGATMSDEDYWFHLYVMLSRVRHISQLLLFDLPEKNTLEQGPADWVVRNLVGLNAKAASMEQRARVAQALKKMEWTVAIRRAGGSGSHPDPIAQHFVHQTEAESTPPKPTPSQPSPLKTKTRKMVEPEPKQLPSTIARDSVHQTEAESIPRKPTPSQASPPPTKRRKVVKPEPKQLPSKVAARPSPAPRPTKKQKVQNEISERISMQRIFETQVARAVPDLGFSNGDENIRPLPFDMSALTVDLSKEQLCASLYFTDDGKDDYARLPNLGNTCFVNAAVQVLLRVEPLWLYCKARAALCTHKADQGCIPCLIYEQGSSHILKL